MADESAAETFFRWGEEKTSFRRVIGIVFSVIRLATASPSFSGHGEWRELGSRDIDHTTRRVRVRERDAIESIRPWADWLMASKIVI